MKTTIRPNPNPILIVLFSVAFLLFLPLGYLLLWLGLLPKPKRLCSKTMATMRYNQSHDPSEERGHSTFCHRKSRMSPFLERTAREPRRPAWPARH